MIIYDEIIAPTFYDRLLKVEGKYAVENTDGNYYRFTYPPYEVAIDFENILLGVGVPYQCDKMYFTKRTESMKTVYKQFRDPNYAVLLYFINKDYTGGEIEYKGENIKAEANRAVYFDSGIDVELTDVSKGTQYLLISYFRKSPIKNSKTLI